MMYQSSYRRPGKGRVDWVIVFCYLALVLFGWLNIYASVHAGEPSSIFDFSFRCGKQAVWILTALGLATLILYVINPQFWEVTPGLLYTIVVFLLVVVIFVGDSVKGSNSWFTLGPVSFQPAEVSKITTSLLVATIMGQSGFRLSRRRDFVTVAFTILLPMLIIVAEKETGSALVYLGFLFVLYREGLTGWLLAFGGLAIALFVVTLKSSPFVSVLMLLTVVSFIYRILEGELRRWCVTDALFIVFMAFLPKILGWLGGRWEVLAGVRPMVILGLSCAGGLVWYGVRAFRRGNPGLWVAIAATVAGVLLVLSTNVLFNDVLQPHQQQRIEVLLGMKDDPSGVGYNVTQSKIAIGAGGLWGKGFLHGTQTTYGFVPEQSTDFIFCTVGEEWGFVGCLVVILLYVVLIWRIIADAESGRSAFTRIYGYCVASIIFMHLFINIGMTIGIMPVIGIPLPFLSYGGSSLWAFTVLLFIFLALDREEKKYF